MENIVRVSLHTYNCISLNRFQIQIFCTTLLPRPHATPPPWILRISSYAVITAQYYGAHGRSIGHTTISLMVAFANSSPAMSFHSTGDP